MINQQDLIAAIVTEIKDLVPELRQRPIAESDSLRELGLNSMDRVDVIMAALALAGVRIPMTAFAGLKNIEEIARRILQESH
jgi:polyketide biosynthesis acyl carrier protein